MKGRFKKVKVCRWCGGFHDVRATRCMIKGTDMCTRFTDSSDFIVIEIDTNKDTMSKIDMGKQEFTSKTEDDYMNRDGMSPRERWLQQFKEKK